MILATRRVAEQYQNRGLVFEHAGFDDRPKSSQRNLLRARYALRSLSIGSLVVVSSLALATVLAERTQATSEGSVVKPGVDPQLTSSAFLALLPDGETKRRFILDCAGCHQFDERIAMPDGSPRTRASWAESTELMLSFAGAHTSFPIISASRDADATADWLYEHLTDRTPVPIAPTASAEVTITEFDLPRPDDLPHDVAVDSEGRVIVTGMMSQVMYVLDPESGTFEEHAIPVEMGGPRAVEVDGDGAWWIVLGGPQLLARYEPAESSWDTWELGMYPHEIARDSRGRVWFNGHFTKQPEQLGYVAPLSGEVKVQDVPVPPMPGGGSTIPYGLRSAPDGSIWMTELIGGRLVKFDPQTEAFTLYDLPTPFSGPRRLDIDDQGIVWVPEFANNRLARFDPTSETFTEYELPTPDALPYVARVDHRTGVVWVATAGADLIARFDPSSESFTEYRLPTKGALVRHIDIDARTGDVWGAYAPFPPVSPKVFRVQSR